MRAGATGAAWYPAQFRAVSRLVTLIEVRRHKDESPSKAAVQTARKQAKLLPKIEQRGLADLHLSCGVGEGPSCINSKLRVLYPDHQHGTLSAYPHPM